MDLFVAVFFVLSKSFLFEQFRLNFCNQLNQMRKLIVTNNKKTYCFLIINNYTIPGIECK